MDRLIRNHLVSSQSMITFTFLYLLWLSPFEWFPFPFSFPSLFFFIFSFLSSIMVKIWKRYGLCGQRPFSIKSEYDLDSHSYICAFWVISFFYFPVLFLPFFFFLSFLPLLFLSSHYFNVDYPYLSNFFFLISYF